MAVTRDRSLLLVRYYSISALVVGFWLLALCVWIPGKVSTEVMRPHDYGRQFAHARVLTSLESEAEEAELAMPEGTFDPLSPLEATSEGDIAALQASLPRLYHSPELFALSYDEMWNRMQVWVYPEQQKGSERYEHRYDGGEEGVTEELSSTADLFFRLLKRSEFVTESPAHAHLFLMPVSIDALWVDLGPTHVADQLRRYLQKIRTDYPFWDSSLGADHLYLSCHAFPLNSKHRNILEFGKNAIQATCSPLRHNQQFYPHKDMVFPEYKPVTEDEIRTALATRTERTTLAYFPAAATEFTSDAVFDVESDPSPHRSSVYAKLARSRFCVSLPPHESLSVVDALRFGCVPVLVSKTVFYDLPFQGFLKWREFAIVVGLEELQYLKSILGAITAEKYRQMQYLGHQASKHLEWNNPPVAYDAFHMTLVELWVRRHSIKYARQTVS